MTDIDGDLLFTNDTSILVITDDAPIDGVEVPVIDVVAQAAEAEAMLAESEESTAEESPEA